MIYYNNILSNFISEKSYLGLGVQVHVELFGDFWLLETVQVVFKHA